jgi:hypothetical protein
LIRATPRARAPRPGACPPHAAWRDTRHPPPPRAAPKTPQSLRIPLNLGPGSDDLGTRSDVPGRGSERSVATTGVVRWIGCLQCPLDRGLSSSAWTPAEGGHERCGRGGRRLRLRTRAERDSPSMLSPKTNAILIGYGSGPARDIGIDASIFVHSESPDLAKILGDPRSMVARDTAKAPSTNSSNSPRIFRTVTSRGWRVTGAILTPRSAVLLPETLVHAKAVGIASPSAASEFAASFDSTRRPAHTLRLRRRPGGTEPSPAFRAPLRCCSRHRGPQRRVPPGSRASPAALTTRSWSSRGSLRPVTLAGLVLKRVGGDSSSSVTFVRASIRTGRSIRRSERRLRMS